MIETIKKSRILSFVLIFLMYIVATFAGILIFSLNKSGNDILYLFYADFVATVIIWLFGIPFSNSSVYDPYWSVAPPVILTLLAYHYGIFSLPSILLLAAVWFWAIRLTVNWMYTFPNLMHQDWRYSKMREENPGRWQFVNFMGIHFLPTAIVFLAMLPAFFLLKSDTTANIFTYIGFVICIAATLLQLVSDTQMHRFRKKNTGKVCDTGLWKYSRHPNYVGEISFWWGIYILAVSVAPQYWWTIIGALANTFLFVFISIPMMEKRQILNKPEYADYAKNTAVLIPGFKTDGTKN